MAGGRVAFINQDSGLFFSEDVSITDSQKLPQSMPLTLHFFCLFLYSLFLSLSIIPVYIPSLKLFPVPWTGGPLQILQMEVPTKTHAPALKTIKKKLRFDSARGDPQEGLVPD